MPAIQFFILESEIVLFLATQNDISVQKPLQIDPIKVQGESIMEIAVYIASVEKEPEDYVYKEFAVFYIGDEICLINMWL